MMNIAGSFCLLFILHAGHMAALVYNITLPSTYIVQLCARKNVAS